MKYDTSLRPGIARRVEQVEHADVVVGIPCYNNQDTIGHVVSMVAQGLYDNYRDLRPVIIISDGGSTDDTREIAEETILRPWQEKVVSIYRGVAGKGTALRSIFEIAERRTCSAVLAAALQQACKAMTQSLPLPATSRHLPKIKSYLKVIQLFPGFVKRFL